MPFSSAHWSFGKHREKWLLFCLVQRPFSWVAMARTWWPEGTTVWWRFGRPVTSSSCTFTPDVMLALEQWTYPMTRGEPCWGEMWSLKNCHWKFLTFYQGWNLPWRRFQHPDGRKTSAEKGKLRRGVSTVRKDSGKKETEEENKGEKKKEMGLKKNRRI